jgi:sulfur carrier protein ThiS
MVAVNMFNETLDILENKYNEEVGCLMKTKHKNLVCFLGSRTRGIIVDYEGKFVMTDVFQYIYLIRVLISMHVYVA